MSHVEIAHQAADVRPAFYLDGVDRADFFAVTAPANSGGNFSLHNVTDLRIGQLITCMHVGNLPEEVAMKNNQLFGEKVAPKLRDIWGDQEDRWTPQVSQQRVAAANAAAGR